MGYATQSLFGLRAPATRRHVISGLSIAGLCTLLAGAASAGDRRTEADKLVAEFARRTSIKDFAVLLGRNGQPLYSRFGGQFTARTFLPLASASKWLVGATVMALVDRGLIDLDEPIGRHVSGLSHEYRALRISQLLSFTAGLPGIAQLSEFRQPEGLSLAQSASLIAQAPLANAPGARFDYGGPSLQLVGAAAEALSNKRWQTIFDELIARPTGMTDTLWGRPTSQPIRDRLPPNPILQAGAWSTPADYQRFLAMLSQEGISGGSRVLTSDSIRQMNTILTADLPKSSIAGLVTGQAEYMIAHWCEQPRQERCDVSSSPGFFGTEPWIDRPNDLFGGIYVRDLRRRIADDERWLRSNLTNLFATRER